MTTTDSLSPFDAGIRVSIGASGSGKTYGQNEEIEKAATRYPVIYIDRMLERNNGTDWAPTTREIIPKIKGPGLYIVRPTVEADDWTLNQVVEACRFAIKYRASFPHKTAGDKPLAIFGIVVPEAHRAMPNSKLHPSIESVVTAWRHYQTALFVDSQRFALLNRTLTEMARQTRIYATTGPLDIDAVKEFGGADLVPIVKEATKRCADGEPGWHIRLGMFRSPPYELERFKRGG